MTSSCRTSPQAAAAVVAFAAAVVAAVVIAAVVAVDPAVAAATAGELIKLKIRISRKVVPSLLFVKKRECVVNVLGKQLFESYVPSKLYYLCQTPNSRLL